MPDQFSQPNDQPNNQPSDQNDQNPAGKIMDVTQDTPVPPLESQPETGAINNTGADALNTSPDSSALSLNSAAAEKSPLESAYVPNTSPIQPAPENQVADTQPPAVGAEDSEPVKAPDTDEFLKRILEDNPADASVSMGSTELSQPTTPSEPTSSGVDTQPAAESFPATPAAQEQVVTNEPPQDIEQQIPTAGINPPATGAAPSETAPQTQTEPAKIADATSNLDSIFTQPASQTPGQGEQIASDMVGAMKNKAPQPTGSSTKLIGLAALALILVGGGYFAYNSLFSADSTSTNSSSTATENTSTSDVTELTNDEVRKTDLTSLQSTLADYWANENKYPISNGLEFLNTSGNSLEKALIPSYLQVLPTDPDPAKKYAYKSDGTTYTLTAVADDQYDSDAISDGDLYIFKATPDTTLTASSASTSGSSSVGFDSAEASSGSTTTTSTIPSPPVPSDDLALPE